MRKFTVTGMSCAACSGNVERAVSKLDGVESCSVSLLTKTLAVEGNVSDVSIIKAVERAGYGASVQSADKGKQSGAADSADSGQNKDSTENREMKALIIRLVTSVVFLLVLVYFSMGHSMWGWPLPSFFTGNYIAIGLVELILSAIIIVINRKFFINGFKGIFRGALNMDTLVGLGSGVAFGYSVYVLFALTGAQAAGDMQAVAHYAGEFYFESSAMILTLITLGKTLENYSKGKTTNALKSLMKLAPQTAVLLRDGEEIEVGVSQVVIGDIFVVRPGGNIPVDGEIIEGTSTVNEAALTGESIPTDKTVGSNVSAGTVNLSGYIKCRATRVGEDTTLSQIIRMVGDAAATKAPVARVADKVSAIFVPIVLGLALVTLIVWLSVGREAGYALARAISVLVISCPCALGLATPVAIMVGNGMGARHGILYKTSAALEQTGRTRIVVLDKTGTITKGEPEVTDVLPQTGKSADELIRLAYLLESKSEHPLSKAIIKRAEEDGILLDQTVDDFKVLPGNGLIANVDGKELIGGNMAFMQSKLTVSMQVKELADSLSADGKTPLFFAYGSELLGIIAVADTVRDDSVRAIKELKDMGLHVVMLTGDNRTTAQAIGKLAGVDEVIADVLPNEKEDAIKRLQQFGRVAMVGDGINDAPALTRADVGIAIGAGTDVAIDAADVVLVKSNLLDVPAAIRLSKSTLRDIHQNLFWAFIYNIIGIPLAAGVWIPVFGWEMNPMFGAAAMSLSSVCVVLNALRLNLLDIRKTRKYRHRQALPIVNGKLLDDYNPHTDNANLDNKCKENSDVCNTKGNDLNQLDTMKSCKLNDIEECCKADMDITINVDGMMCSHCEKRVRESLEAIDGVVSAVADHEAGTAVVKTDKPIDVEVLEQAIQAQGYTVIK